MVAAFLLGMPLAQPARAEATDKDVLATAEKVAPTIEEVAKKLWDFSEVSLLESKSSAFLRDMLEQHGRRSHRLYCRIREWRTKTWHHAGV